MPYRAAGQGQLNAVSILLKILRNGKLSSQKQSLEQKLPHKAVGQGQLNATSILQEDDFNLSLPCADFYSGYRVHLGYRDS